MKILKKAGYTALAGTMGVAVSSCGKYEDGPGISLLTKKARLVREWEVVQMGNQVLPQNGYSLEFEFEKDGDFKQSYSYGTYSYSYAGDWEFSNDKEEIEITMMGQVTDFEILRLTNKELWFEDQSNQEWRLEAK
jgi:hypothetical protein